jgi:aminoglycoside phosphotransferase (APT) family kinase protein
VTHALAGRTGSAWRTRPERWAALTEPGPARALLQEQLPGFATGELVIERCELHHLRFRTSPDERRGVKPIVAAAYALDVRDALHGRRGTQLLYVAAYEGRGRGRFDKARAVDRAAPRFGSAVAYLPDLDAVAWAFPNDPRLPHLPALAEPGGGIETSVLRWKPTFRCVLSHRRPDGAARIAKVVRAGGAAEIGRRMEWMRRASHVDGFLVARPLGVDAALDAAWQEEIPGAALMQVILDGADAAPLMDAAARGLAALHRMAPDETLPRQEPAMRLLWPHGGPRELAQAVPALRPRLAAMSARLAREAAAMRVAPPRLVHGDFLLKQLVVHEGRLAVFDFDGLMVGDCLEDVAKCLADLHYWDLEPSRVRSLAARFLDAYRAHASEDVPADRLRWHYAVQVLGDAWYWYKRRQFEPEFARELEELLARAGDPPVY